MDALLRDYPAVVTAVGALLVATLGYLFGRWNSDRNRRLQKHDAITDMRIKDARDYVDAKFMDIEKISQAVTLLQAMKTNTDVEASVQAVLDGSDELKSVWGKWYKKYSSVVILNDDRLDDLIEELHSVLSPLLHRVVELMEQTTLEVKDYEIVAFSKSLTKARRLFTKAHQRLDELAQK